MTSIIASGGGPKTLSRQGFRSTAASKKPGSTYEGYLAYINRRRAAKLAPAAAGADPFAQTSDADISSIIDRTYGPALNNKQITGQAQGMLDPVVAALTAGIDTRAKQATGAIGLNSAAAAKALGQIDYGAPYAKAETGQAAVDEALRSSLAGDGGRLSADLKTRLGAIEDPTVAAAAGNVAATGQAAGNTELARGSASLSDLLAHAAAARSYGTKQPGIARLAGLQDIAGVEQGAVNDVADAKTRIMQLLPGVVESLRGERGNRANLLAQLRGQNITKATAAAGLAGDQATAAYQTQSLNERTRHDQAIENAKTAPKPLTVKERNAAIGKLDEYYYGVQPKQHYDTSRHTFVDVPGTGIPGVDYQTAITNLVNAFGITAEQATSLANTRYKPGEDGRPATAAMKTAAVSKAAHGREADARATGAPAAATPPAQHGPERWDPQTDPVVGPGPTGTGLHRTKSGRLVDQYGNYARL